MLQSTPAEPWILYKWSATKSCSGNTVLKTAPNPYQQNREPFLTVVFLRSSTVFRKRFWNTTSTVPSLNAGCSSPSRRDARPRAPSCAR